MSGMMRRWPLARWTAALLAGAALLLLLLFDGAARYGAQRWALGQVRAEAEAAAVFRAAMLRSEIEKQRTLPVVLSQDPDVRAALTEGDAKQLEALDLKFEALASATRAGVIYLVDPKGITIAASNFRTPISFVGSDYSFRPYFTRAMAEGQAEHFALGTVTHEPGLYISRRIDGLDGPLGVLVVKALFDVVEDDWRHAADPTFVTDPRDIVLVTSVPDWRFRALKPIPPEEAEAIRTSLQFGAAPLDLLPLRRVGEEEGRVDWTGARGGSAFVESSVPVPTTLWTLHVLAPFTATAQLASVAARSLALLVGLVILCTLAFVAARRRRLGQERRQQEAMRHELEESVVARTAELSEANERLRAEMDERRRAAIAARRAQDELAQAGKLSLLGQIAASVAHEVNQPVAAIRTFAENGEALIAKGQMEVARGNFATIAGLTDRIGAITHEIRSFARKSSPVIGPVSLSRAIEGTLLLIGPRLRQDGIELTLDLPEEDVSVRAERWRLEQVLVNLLQNAAEALAGRPDGRIRISGTVKGETVELHLADNGPGLPAEVLESLFLPFRTTKPDGLGLGLVLSHDIVAEFGGSLTAANDGGAVFTLTLPRLV